MPYPDHAIAVIGMSLRFPGASNPDTFWKNTLTKDTQIRLFTPDELIGFGVDPDLVSHKDFVPAMATIEGLDQFDHHFFDMSPREAEITDPQHRLFLECGYEALEHAGYAKVNPEQRVGVFGGTGASSYFMHHLFNKPDLRKSVGDYQLNLSNGADFITTRLSYKLNLSGPSLNVQTGCSTGLTAVHLACQQLLLGDCDMALAGASSLAMPHQYGYIFREGGIAAKDGYCRPFDRKATGTVRGNGVGFVVLKRLQDAIEDEDNIDAVILGAGINNDGADKVGFTAPSVDGQANAIRDALMLAGVEPESIDYIETHGTGTPMGDPIELAALEGAYGTNLNSTCALSSVKSQIGHLDVAAGIAGLIRAILALKNRTIPPTANFESPNPAIPFKELPFYVASDAEQWTPGASDKPFRAGVSSFGIGGTNLHLILEEFPQTNMEPARSTNTSHSLFLTSAKTEPSAKRMSNDVIEYSNLHPEYTADISSTLAHKRPFYSYRSYQVKDQTGPDYQTSAISKNTVPRKTVLMFSGQGDSLTNYGKWMSQESSPFRKQVTEIFNLFADYLKHDLNEIFKGNLSTGSTLVDQPILFTFQYAVGNWLMNQCVQPDYLMGHSIGELTAAALAGVWSLEDAVKVVATRARIMQDSPVGAMAAVGITHSNAIKFITQFKLDVEVSSVNAENLTILGGTTEAIQQLQEVCNHQKLFCRKLVAEKAFHTSLFKDAAQSFKKALEEITFNEPVHTLYSNVRGGIAQIENGDCVTPDYWGRHLRESVLLADIFKSIPSEPCCFIEMGPGKTLLKLVHKVRSADNTDAYIATSDVPYNDVAAHIAHLNGQLWTAGIEQPALQAIPKNQKAVRLPSYPFDHSRFWIPKANHTSGEQLAGITKRNEHAIYTRQWKRLPRIKQTHGNTAWIIISESEPILNNFKTQIDHTVFHILVKDDLDIGKELEQKINEVDSDFEVQLLYIPKATSVELDTSASKSMYLSAKIFSEIISIVDIIRKIRPIHCSLVTSFAQQVIGTEKINPDHRWLDGMSTGVKWDTGLTSFSRIDIEPDEVLSADLLFDCVLAGISSNRDHTASLYAIRKETIWEETLLEEALPDSNYTFNQKDIWVLIGGNGSIGSALREYLNKAGIRCAVISRSVEYQSTKSELYIKADVTKPAEIKAALKDIKAKWAKIDYIVHLASYVGESKVNNFDSRKFAAINAPKIEGLRNIIKSDLDSGTHIVLFSSLSSILGGMGHAGYSAANAWLDAAACLMNGKGNGPTITSFSWDTWRFDFNGASNSPSISKEFGLELLFKMIQLPEQPHWIISSISPSLRKAEQMKEAHSNDTGATIAHQKPAVTGHPRPALSVAYEAPANALEEAISKIWGKHLSIEAVGVNDNFFDLGGDSLLLVHLHSELETLSEQPLSKTDLFEHSTIRELAAFMIGESGSISNKRKQQRTQKMKQQLFNQQ